MKGREAYMAIYLDHTIVPAKDKLASAKFLAEIFGLTVTSVGRFVEIQINESALYIATSVPFLVHAFARRSSAASIRQLSERVRRVQADYRRGLPIGSACRPAPPPYC